MRNPTRWTGPDGREWTEREVILAVTGADPGPEAAGLETLKAAYSAMPALHAAHRKILLHALHAELGASWRRVGEALGVPYTTVWRAAHPPELD